MYPRKSLQMNFVDYAERPRNASVSTLSSASEHVQSKPQKIVEPSESNAIILSTMGQRFRHEPIIATLPQRHSKKQRLIQYSEREQIDENRTRCRRTTSRMFVPLSESLRQAMLRRTLETNDIIPQSSSTSRFIEIATESSKVSSENKNVVRRPQRRLSKTWPWLRNPIDITPLDLNEGNRDNLALKERSKTLSNEVKSSALPLDVQERPVARRPTYFDRLAQLQDNGLAFSEEALTAFLMPPSTLAHPVQRPQQTNDSKTWPWLCNRRKIWSAQNASSVAGAGQDLPNAERGPGTFNSTFRSDEGKKPTGVCGDESGELMEPESVSEPTPPQCLQTYQERAVCAIQKEVRLWIRRRRKAVHGLALLNWLILHWLQKKWHGRREEMETKRNEREQSKRMGRGYIEFPVSKHVTANIFELLSIERRLQALLQKRSLFVQLHKGLLTSPARKRQLQKRAIQLLSGACRRFRARLLARKKDQFRHHMTIKALRRWRRRLSEQQQRHRAACTLQECWRSRSRQQRWHGIILALHQRRHAAALTLQQRWHRRSFQRRQQLHEHALCLRKWLLKQALRIRIRRFISTTRTSTVATAATIGLRRSLAAVPIQRQWRSHRRRKVALRWRSTARNIQIQTRNLQQKCLSQWVRTSAAIFQFRRKQAATVLQRRWLTRRREVVIRTMQRRRRTLVLTRRSSAVVQAAFRAILRRNDLQRERSRRDVAARCVQRWWMRQCKNRSAAPRVVHMPLMSVILAIALTPILLVVVVWLILFSAKNCSNSRSVR